MNILEEIIKKEEISTQPEITSIENEEFHMIALFIPPEDSFVNAEYFYKLINGINRSAMAKGYNLLLRQQILVPNVKLNNLPVDGFIVIAPILNSPIVKELEIMELPATLINNRSLYLNWVDLDNVSAGKIAVEHLIKLGHKRIVFIGGVKNNQNTQDRLKGYQLALEKNKIKFEEDLVFYGDYETTEAYVITKNLISENKDFSAIFCCNDLMAIGAIYALREKGIRVPEDISIVGFDDIGITESFDPPITTVRQPFSQIGELAVQILVDQIEGKLQEPKQVELQGELVIRKSSGKFIKRKIWKNKI